MFNCRNYGVCTGILAPCKKGETGAITEFNVNSDGSQRIALAVLAGDNFKSRYTDAELAAMSPEVRAKRVGADGKGYKNQRISLTKFLPYDKQHGQPLNITMYRNLKAGDMVQVVYTIKSGSYTKPDGKVEYTTSLEIETVQVLKHAATTAAAPAPAAAPIPAEGVNNDPDFTGDQMDEPF